MDIKESEIIQPIRLNKYLAGLGVASRRTIDEYISAGKIKINSKINTELGVKIDPLSDEIEVDGKKIIYKPEELTYVILNKPRGILSTVEDEEGRTSVTDLVKLPLRLYPVGRLDKDSHGLILLTNDGELAYKLTHPKYHVPKVYRAKMRGFVTNQVLAKMRRGVNLEDGKTARSKVKIIYRNSNETMLEITLFEGKKRQIRRMSSALRITLLDLQRISIGSIQLGDLEMGRWRTLDASEVEQLRVPYSQYQQPTTGIKSNIVSPTPKD
jgi:23S rRNA pseudouridine2605 synthase